MLELRAELVALQKQADERNALHEREVKRAKQASDRTADMYRCIAAALRLIGVITLLDDILITGSRMLSSSVSGEMTGQGLAPVPTRCRLFNLQHIIFIRLFQLESKSLLKLLYKVSTLEADDSRTGEDSFVGGTPVVQKKVGAQHFVMLTRGAVF